MPEFVKLFEMGPRDGLQNEQRPISTADKIHLVNLLSETGLRSVEVTSFVSPKWVPQMADAAAVLASIDRRPGTTYAALTPNLRGFEAALAANATEVAVFASASEGFSQANINCSIAESLARFVPLLQAAGTAGVAVRGYVSCVTECPYDGPTPPANVAKTAAALFAMGCYEVSLGDTLGHATPDTTRMMLDAVLGQVPAAHLAGHFHDTRKRALDNISVALDLGLRVFDAAVGGLGGCPYAPGAAGNVATEAVVEMLHSCGYSTGIDPEKLALAAAFAKTLRTQ
jgi:hydroxymethylglutaryl-CoA lyase